MQHFTHRPTRWRPTTINELASIFGCSKQYISALKQEGRLPTRNNKLVLIDALEFFAGSGNASQRKTAKGILGLPEDDGQPIIGDIRITEDNVDEMRRGILEKINTDPATAVRIGQALELWYKTDRADRERLVAVGELFHRSAILREFGEAVAKCNAKLHNIAARVATQCEGRSARDIEKIIGDEINDALMELQRTRFTGTDQ